MKEMKKVVNSNKKPEGNLSEDVEEAGAHCRNRLKKKKKAKGTSSLSKVVPPSPK